jgi:hypothetical protein
MEAIAVRRCVAQKVGGMKHLAEIAETLDQGKK